MATNVCPKCNIRRRQTQIISMALVPVICLPCWSKLNMAERLEVTRKAAERQKLTDRLPQYYAQAWSGFEEPK